MEAGTFANQCERVHTKLSATAYALVCLFVPVMMYVCTCPVVHVSAFCYACRTAGAYAYMRAPLCAHVEVLALSVLIPVL